MSDLPKSKKLEDALKDIISMLAQPAPTLPVSPKASMSSAASSPNPQASERETSDDVTDRESTCDPIAVTIDDAAKAIGMSRAWLYPHVGKDLDAYKFGNSTRILVPDLLEFAKTRPKFTRS